MAENFSDSREGRLASFIAPTAADEELPVRAATVRIGQGPQNDLVLDDDSVSTNHARLEHRGGSWLLTDLESRNGTFINRTRLVPGVATDVPDGASVAFGALELRFRYEAVAIPVSEKVGTPPERGVERRNTGFRLPVWLALLILLVIVAIAFLVITLTGGPAVPEPTAGAGAVLHLAGLDPGPA